MAVVIGQLAVNEGKVATRGRRLIFAAQCFSLAQDTAVRVGKTLDLSALINGPAIHSVSHGRMVQLAC